MRDMICFQLLYLRQARCLESHAKTTSPGLGILMRFVTFIDKYNFQAQRSLFQYSSNLGVEIC